MAKNKVFILQEKQESVDEIVNILSTENYEIIGKSTDGSVAVEEIEANSPDIIILGLLCSNLDGLAVLESVQNNAKIKSIVVSSIAREQVVRKAIELGASYYLLKPLKPEVLLSRLKDLTDSENGTKKERTNLDEKISKIFISVGIPPHIKGYAYLREGVKMAVRSPEIINNITKRLYPGIGEKYETSASKVERAIRHAIEVAWSRGKIENINSIFGVRAYASGEKPTNGEFIALIADKMILDGE